MLDTIETLARIRQLTQEEIPFRKIEGILHISRWSLTRICKKHNISYLNRKEAARKSRTLILPDTLFVFPLDNDQSWILGLLLTDGCITYHQGYWNISLASTDKDILEKVQAITSLGSIHRSNIDRSDRKKGWKWSVQNNELGERLIYLGLVQRKSKVLCMPNLNYLQLPHFIRGLWDGDGCICYSKKKLQTNFRSASLSFSQTLLEVLKPITKSHSSVHTDKKGYHIIVYRIDASTNLLRWMYQDSTSENRMERKYEIAKQFLT